MKRSISARFVAAAALATASLGAAPVAHANPDIYFSVGVQGRPVYMEPEPVYVPPQPVYLQPRPVYIQPRPVYVQPRPVYVQPRPIYVKPRPVYVQPPAYVYERPWRPSYDSGYEEERSWQRADWQRRHWKHHRHDRDEYQFRGRNRD